MRMTFYCDLYVTEELKKKKVTLIRKLQRNTFPPSVFVITLSQGAQNHLEFYSALLYKQHFFEKVPIFVVGIAKDYDDAVNMIEKIVHDIYKKTNGVDIRNYIIQRQQEYKESGV